MANIDSLLHDLIVASVKSQEGIKQYTKATSDSLNSLIDNYEKISKQLNKLTSQLSEINQTRIDLYKFLYKSVAPIVLTLLIIIGTLLYNQNVGGSKTITDISKKVLNITH